MLFTCYLCGKKIFQTYDKFRLHKVKHDAAGEKVAFKDLSSVKKEP
jgi:DNA-directed RNA polymerase subunit N (RpoN/RPB10)